MFSLLVICRSPVRIGGTCDLTFDGIVKAEEKAFHQSAK
jgi:hypothetical protein